MKLSNQSKSLINQIVTDLIERYSNLEDSVVTDIHFQPLYSSGELLVFNDEDEELAHVTIGEFEGLTGSDTNNVVAGILRRALDLRHHELEELSILKPYSFVLVDEDRESIEDLLLVDDDFVIADNGLMAGLDEDLNAFLKKLLED